MGTRAVGAKTHASAMLTLRLLPLLGALCSAALVATPLASAKSSPAFVDLSFEAALQRAAAEQKIVFVDFYTTWCGPCKMLDESTWQDAAVIALLQTKAVALKIDAEKERDLAARYKVEGYPTLLLLKADGTEIDRIVGYRPADKFLEEFNAGLAGQTSLARTRSAVTNAPSGPAQVQARYLLGNELARTGQPAAALAEYLWCYDEGMVKETSFQAVRLSFLLGSLSHLAQSYPPARDALVQRRDAALAAAQNPEASRQTMAELVSLNRTLREEDATLTFFDTLPAGDRRRAALAKSLFDKLVEARRYADAVSGIPFAEATQRLDRFLALPLGSETEEQRMNHDLVSKAFTRYLEAFAGAGELEHANELLRRARAFDASPEALASFRSALERAGHPELLATGPANGG